MENYEKLLNKAEEIFENAVGWEFWLIVDYVLGVERLAEDVRDNLQSWDEKQLKNFIKEFGKSKDRKEAISRFLSV